jgi:hypothetical protein
VILIAAWKDINTREAIELSWRYVFSVFGIPKTSTSDRDKLFRSKEWKSEMSKIGVEVILSTAEHQQTDGQSERKIQEVEQFLRNYLDHDQKNWIQLLPKAQYAMNDAYNSITELTPNQTVFGQESNEGLREQDKETILGKQQRMKTIDNA